MKMGYFLAHFLKSTQQRLSAFFMTFTRVFLFNPVQAFLLELDFVSMSLNMEL